MCQYLCQLFLDLRCTICQTKKNLLITLLCAIGRIGKEVIKMLKKCTALFFAFLLICIGISSHAQEKSTNRIVSERLIVQIDLSSWISESLRVSPDSRRVAYVAQVGNKWFVVVDSKEEKQYDSIGAGAPIFSPVSRRVAYVAQVGNKCFVVVDGKEEKQYDGIVTIRGGKIIFHATDSLYYLAQKGESIFLVEERIKGKDKENK